MKMKKTILTLLSALLLVACGGNTQQEAAQPGNTLVNSIQQCAKLNIAQYKVHKVIVYEDPGTVESNILFEKISIPIPGKKKILIPVDATVKTYIDFSRFGEGDIRKEGEKIFITLPEPQIELVSSKIDYENEKSIVSWNRSDFTEKEREEFIRQGRDSILTSLAQNDIIGRSCANAFNALLPILTSAGFKPEDVTISFPDKVEKDRTSKQTVMQFTTLPKLQEQ